MPKALYKLHFDCGRQGTYRRIFVDDTERVEKLIASGGKVYFGEVLGKHSEIYGPLEESDLTKVTEDPTAIKIVQELEILNESPVDTYIWHEEDQGREHAFSSQPHEE